MNPLKFPLKIIPKKCIQPKILYDIKGNLIPESERFKSMKLFMCEMSKYQYKQYKIKSKSYKNPPQVIS